MSHLRPCSRIGRELSSLFPPLLISRRTSYFGFRLNFMRSMFRNSDCRMRNSSSFVSRCCSSKSRWRYSSRIISRSFLLAFVFTELFPNSSSSSLSFELSCSLSSWLIRILSSVIRSSRLVPSSRYTGLDEKGSTV